MSRHRVTKTTSQGLFSRIGGAIKGIVVGLVLIMIAFGLLFWNEGRAVKTAKSLEEGASAVVSVSAESVDPANDGNLIHFTGQTVVGSPVSDPIFGISTDALALRRTVEMYQWQETSRSETREKLGGGTETVTTYEYNQGWHSNRIDSSRFEEPRGHQNPTEMRYQDNTVRADNVTVGAFTLSENLIGQASNYQDYRLDDEFLNSLPANIRGEAQLSGNHLYFGINPSTPSIGDTRVSFSTVPAGVVSVVAQQSGTTLTGYQTRAGRTLSMLSVGTHTAEAMFEAAMAANVMMTWILRFGGFLAMFIGFSMLLAPLRVVASIVPFVGKIVGAGTTLIAGLVSAGLSFITIAVAWIFYRPLLGILLFIVAGGLIAGVTFLIMKAKAPPVTDEPLGADAEI